MSVLDVKTRSIQAFIDANPLDIILTRSNKADDGMGGEVVTGTTVLAEQLVRVVGLNPPIVRISPDGREITINKVVVGMPNTDIKPDDLFEYNDQLFEVIYVSDAPFGYHKLAGVASRGE